MSNYHSDRIGFNKPYAIKNESRGTLFCYDIIIQYSSNAKSLYQSEGENCQRILNVHGYWILSFGMF